MTTLRNPLRLAEGYLIQTWLGRVLLAAILLLIVGSGIVLSRRLLTPAGPDQLLRGQQLAWELVTALENDLTVTEVTGTYLPDRGLILQSTVTIVDATALRAWTQQRLEPFLSRFANFPAAEELIWLIDLPVSGTMATNMDRQQQEILTVSFGQIDDPLHYAYISNLRPSPVQAQSSAGTASITDDTTVTKVETKAETTQESLPIPAAVEPATSPPIDTEVTEDSNASDTPTLLRSLDFDPTTTVPDAPSEWLLISGTWSAQNGYFRQSDSSGYDYIAMLNLAPQQAYQLEVALRMDSGEMGGGVIYNAPSQEGRAGAQIIDMDEQGRYLRWGRYDQDGLYIFEGGVNLDVGLSDGDWHQLRLDSRGEAGTIWFDGQEVGRTTNRSTAGYVGLVTSRAEMDFDNLTVTTLPAIDPTMAITTATESTAVTSTSVTTASLTTASLTTVSATAGTTTTLVSETESATTTAVSSLSTGTGPVTETAILFADAFDAENRNGWQVLDGTWQFLDGTYQQTSLDGTDLGTISTFQGESYRVTASTRLLEGVMGAGLYFNMASRTSAKQSQLIHFRDGKTLQWGAFDEGGNFILQGSTAIPNIGDGNWHALTVEVTAGTASFAVDNVVVANTVPLRYTAGYLGLFTGKSRVAFDDLVVTAMSPSLIEQQDSEEQDSEEQDNE